MHIWSDPKEGPEELHIELTYRCDSRCIMCDLWDYHKRSPNSWEELSLDEIKTFVEQAQYLKNIKTVVLSGGEPFLRRDLADICGLFVSHLPDSSIGILTGGLNTAIIIKKMREIINRFGPKSIWLGTSLDGIGEIHDRVRGVKGAFDRFKKTIELSRKELPEVNLSATFTLTPYNVDQLIPAKEFADKEGLDFFAQFVVPKPAREKFVWTEAQLKEIEGNIRKIIKDLINNIDYRSFLNSVETDGNPALLTKLYYWSHLVRYQREPKRFFKRCIAGTRFAMLDPYGNLFFCPILKEKIVGNVREEKFDTLWMSENAQRLRKFIEEENCHCWLVCIIFPLVGEVLAKRRELKVINANGRESNANLREYKENIHVDSSSISTVRNAISNGVSVNLCPSVIEKHKESNELKQKNNIALNDAEYASRKIILESKPQGVGIGAHYGCNANCIFCLGGEHKNFSLESYKNFFERKLSSILSSAEYINLCGFGELLLMPQIEEFLDYINQKMPHVNKVITTNGIPLTKEISKRLIQGKYAVQFSLHTSNARLHKLLTKTICFDQIVDQIRYLASIRKEKAHPHIVLVFLITTLNIENLPDFIRFAYDFGVDGIVCNYTTIYTPAHLKLSCFFKQEITNRMLKEAEDIAEELRIPITLPPRFDADNYLNECICSDPWKYIYIETEGSVLPCCFAGNHIGYLDKEDFEAIWNGRSYQSLRRSLMEERPNGWCEYCYKNDPSNVNEISSHVSFRPDLQQKILKGFNLK